MSNVNHIIADSVVSPPILDFKASANAVKPLAPYTFDMSQAVPSYPTFSKIRERLAADLNDESISFYGDVPGFAELRAKIAASHVLPNLTQEQVLITSGANQAAYLSMTLFFGLADPVLLLEPYYFNYDMALKILGLSPQYYRLDAKEGFRFRAERLIGYLQNHFVKGIFLITPNNPTGACYSPRDIRQLLAYTSTKGIEVILDEAYGAFDEYHLRDAGLTEYVGNGLTLIGTFSKTYSLCGYRVGYLISSPEVLKEAAKVQDTMIICASQLGQRAALHGLNLCEAELLEKRTHHTKAMHHLMLRVKELKHFHLASCGPFFAYLKHPFVGTAAREAALVLYEHTGILGLPGTVFGRTQEDYIRLAYCNLSESDLDRALDQLLAFDAVVLERAKQWIYSEA